MIQDPMVSALQGPQDPTMDALMSPLPLATRVPFLQDWQLKEKGQEMLKDPNRPQYNPENIYKQISPGAPAKPWGGRGKITQDGQDPIAAMFSHPAQHLQRMAGEVVPFPVSPQVADMRRMRHEDMMQDINTRFGQPGLDQYRSMWPSAPIELGPGAAR